MGAALILVEQHDEANGRVGSATRAGWGSPNYRSVCEGTGTRAWVCGVNLKASKSSVVEGEAVELRFQD